MVLTEANIVPMSNSSSANASASQPLPTQSPPSTSAVSDVLEERLINDEYKIWKKNSPYLYDLVMTSSLEWPSLTCQWLPDTKAVAGKDYNEHSLLIGTHTAEGEQNYLLVASASLPNISTEIDSREYNDEKEESGGFGAVGNKVEVRMKVKHEGEVHRARYCPQNPFLVATRSPNAEVSEFEFVYGHICCTVPNYPAHSLHQVFVFDLSKHPSFPAADSPFSPQHRLRGHISDGYGLCWSPHTCREGHLVSCGGDKLICMWDLKAAGGKVDVDAFSKLSGHTDVVEDVAWHMFDPNMIGSVGDDKALKIWDVRRKNTADSAHTKPNAHKQDINSIAFNPSQEHIFATGSSDSNVRLWDLRNLREPVSTLEGHRAEVFNVAWAPFGEGTILGSSSADRRVNIWDLTRIGQEQTPDDAEDGPPELLFVHGGHTSKLHDLAFSSNEDWVVASVSDDNALQVWQMAENIYAKYDDADENMDGGVKDGGLDGVN